MENTPKCAILTSKMPKFTEKVAKTPPYKSQALDGPVWLTLYARPTYDVQYIMTVVADKSVVVVVGFCNHLFYLFFGHLWANVTHDEPELVSTDVSVAVLVENTKRLLDLVLNRVRVLDLLCHHVEKLRKVHRTTAYTYIVHPSYNSVRHKHVIFPAGMGPNFEASILKTKANARSVVFDANATK